MNQLATIDNTSQQLSIENVREHVNLIQKVMRTVMKEGTHYGTIPGCKKPSLYKAGSETLLTTFRIAVDMEVEDLSAPDVIRYRVKTVGKHQLTGIVIGAGIGECSSNEDKYKWRKAVCDEEYENAPETKRRIKYGKSSNGHYTVKQVRTEPDDQANTILKMAKKRSQIDMTLTAMAASDIFTQDIEDTPQEYRTEPVNQDIIRPEYPSNLFDKHFPDWEKLIKGGKPHANIINKLSTTYTLTDEQKKKIMEIE